MHPGHSFAFIGAGPAGLVLASRLREAFPDRSILVVDDTPPEGDHRTFAFWSRDATPYDTDLFAAWGELAVWGPGRDRHALPLGAWGYRAFDVGTWRARMRASLTASEHVRWLDGTVTGLEEDGGGALLTVDGVTHRARWVFDSRFDSHDAPGGLIQSFCGWWVHSAEPVFDPGSATLMDFRLRVEGGVRFWYALPASERRALVMAVTLAPEPFSVELEPYATLLGMREWEVERVEAGTLPLSIGPWERRLGDRTLRIGLAGGCLKASTGYGLTRFVADAEHVVQSLRRTGHPFDIPEESARARWMDDVFLRALERYPEEAADWFEALFVSVPVDRLLRFLDGNGTPMDLVAVARSLPLRRFVGMLHPWPETHSPRRS